MINLAKYIDHTFLKKDAQEKEINKVCDEAIKYNFKALCVYPEFLPLVCKRLKKTKILPITVIDFPGGDKSPEEKVKEAKKAVLLGAKEIDMVIDVLALKDKNYLKVFEGIKKVVDACKKIPVKVIIETCYLNKTEIVIASALAKLAKASFVKTSTGFGKHGAKPEDVFLIKEIVGEDMQVKASGGIKTYENAILMINAGASRLGTSSSIVLLEKKD